MSVNSLSLKNQVKLWWKASRPFSFTASICPVLVAAALATNYKGDVIWIFFPLCLVCSLLIHAGTNLISDYEDFRRGVDTDCSHGSSGILVAKKLKPEQIKKAAIILFVVAFSLGLLAVVVRGIPLLILGIIGIAGGCFYTVSPIGYKYKGLGDFFVFLFMGVLLGAGSFFVLTGTVTGNAVIASLPMGLLIAAVLNANNIRDIAEDKKAGIKTLAIKLGSKKSKIEYYLLILGAYIPVIILMFTGGISLWALLFLLTIPLAIKNMAIMHKYRPGETDTIAELDQKTAQLHLLFGILLVVGILLN